MGYFGKVKFADSRRGIDVALQAINMKLYSRRARECIKIVFIIFLIERMHVKLTLLADNDDQQKTVNMVLQLSNIWLLFVHLSRRALRLTFDPHGPALKAV